MTIKDIETLYDYGDWANKKLFNVMSQLTPDQFTQPVAGSYGSIRNTLVHTLSAEWGWLDRCGGAKRGAALKADDYPTLDSVRRQWNTVEGYVREFLSTLKDADLARNTEYMTENGKRSMPIGELLHHGGNHAVHHRGQVALMLRMLGYAPGNFDILFYYAEKRGVSAW
jgi:uncharacterized damage-inducible protein DinB